jgi:hypothetical protein
MKDTGKTPKKNVDFIESKFYLMMKIPENSPKDSNTLTNQDVRLTHSLSITSTSKTCQHTKFQKLITMRSTEFLV